MPEMTDDEIRRELVAIVRRARRNGLSWRVIAAAVALVADDLEGKRMQRCSICGEAYEGFGHNAEPVSAGRCCETCNVLRVIPERMRRIAHPSTSEREDSQRPTSQPSSAPER